MRRLIRYPIATIVGLSVTVTVDMLEAEKPVILVAIAVVYGVATSLALADWDRFAGGLVTTRRTRSLRWLGAIGGGVGTFGCVALLQLSIPAGVLGFGLVLFTSVHTTVEDAAFEETRLEQAGG